MLIVRSGNQTSQPGQSKCRTDQRRQFSDQVISKCDIFVHTIVRWKEKERDRDQGVEPDQSRDGKVKIAR